MKGDSGAFLRSESGGSKNKKEKNDCTSSNLKSSDSRSSGSEDISKTDKELMEYQVDSV